MIRLPLLGLAALSMTACESQTVDPPINAMAELETINFAPAEPGRSRQEKLASLDATSRAMDAIEQALDGVPYDDVEQADRALRLAVAGLDGEARAKAEQFAAAVLIGTFLDRAPDTDRTREIAAYHTERLVDLGSPEAHVIVRGIAEVGEGWTADQRAEVAARALVVADTRANEREKPRSTALERVEDLNDRTVPREAFEEAVSRLRDIAIRSPRR